jgi:hypothetical protein
MIEYYDYLFIIIMILIWFIYLKLFRTDKFQLYYIKIVKFIYYFIQVYSEFIYNKDIKIPKKIQ